MAHDTQFGVQVNRTARSIRQNLQEAFRRTGVQITPEEWTILSQLWIKDGRSQRDLAVLTSRDRTTVTRLIDGMVEKGLVMRIPDERDRRIARARLTRKGRDLQTRVGPVVAESIRIGARGVKRRDLEITMRTLERVRQNLNDALEERSSS